MYVPVKIYAVLTDPNTSAQIVILRENQNQTFLPIWIGASEANAIRLALEKITVPRPLTHDLLKDILTYMNIRLDKAVINNVHRNTYFASLYLKPILSAPDLTASLREDIALLTGQLEKRESHIDDETDPTTIQIDSRPSDAIVLSLRYGSPLYVAQDVLTQQGDNSELTEWLTHIRPEEA